MSKVTFIKLDDYNGLGKAIQMTGETLELVVTTDIGPRILKYSVIGGKNIFDDQVPITEKVFDDTWKIYGGHRIWHAPEAYPRSYMPDSIPVESYELLDNGIILVQKEEPWTHIQKVMEIRMFKNHISICNRLINKGAWPIKASVWSLTIGGCGGREIVPIVQRNTGLLANRSVVLWPNCAMNDEKIYWGKKYIAVDCTTESKADFKFGCANEYGWAAYFNHNCCLIKKYKHIRGAEYPDYGCSWETYTANWGVELESLSPLETIMPGAAIDHEDELYLFDNVKYPSRDEEEIDLIMAPLAEKASLEMPVEDLRYWMDVITEDGQEV